MVPQKSPQAIQRQLRCGRRARSPWIRALVVLALTLVGAIAYWPASAWAATPEPTSGESRDLSRPLRVGVQTDDYPYSFRDKDGKVKGFAIDIVDAIARTMDLKLEQLVTNNDPKQLQTDELDILPLLAETEARRRLADFSVPVLRLETVVVVRHDDPRIRRLSDLAGKRVAVGMAGTAGHEYLKKRHPGAIAEFIPSPTALALVADSKLDAVVLSRLTAMSELTRQRLTTLEILPERMIGFDVRRGIAVRHGDTLLLARLNEGLAILHRTGEFKEIQDRWLGQYETRTFTWRELIAALSGLMLVAAGIVAAVLRRQRKLAERVNVQDDELANQRSLLAALYENHPLATLVLTGAADSAPRLMSWNSQAQSLLALAADTPAGQPLDGLDIEPEMKPLIAAVLSHWTTASPVKPWETSLSSSGRILESEMLFLERSSSGARSACVLTGDVTMRRFAEQGAAQARRLQALGEMVGGIAHEFNNLLTPITATVDVMRRTFVAVKGLDEDLQILGDAAQRAAELTHRLLSFGRKTDICPRAVHVAEVATNCLALLRPACDRRIEWVTRIPTELRALEFNPTDLHQILLNLVINARDTLLERLAKSTDGQWSPRITIHVEEVAAHAHQPREQDAHRELCGWQILTVEDNGIGIPAVIRDRIFEPFFTTKDVGKGTGLGLATVWHLAVDAGGRVSVDSTEGEGTAFHVALPRWRFQVSIPAASLPKQALASLASLRVFLVEDDRLLARACLRGLVGLGHTVTHAVDGLEAWHAFEHGDGKSFDVLLTDVNMPNMGGLELVQRVRAAGFRGAVIVMSGRADTIPTDTESGLQIDQILAKPFTVADVVTKMAQVTGPSVRGRQQRESPAS